MPQPDLLAMFQSLSGVSHPQTSPATSINTQSQVASLSPARAAQLSDSCLKAAQDLREVCQASLRGMLRQATDVTEEQQIVWGIAHAQQTRTWADEALARARELIAKARTVPDSKHNKDKKSLFNHEYTPLLEKYFEYNAYPSAPDRAVLARKSMMTPRQIEVWFQNHRNRAKKEGKPLRKLTEDPLPLKLSLRSLKRKMPFFTIPECERNPIRKREPPPSDRFLDDEGIVGDTRFCYPHPANNYDVGQVLTTNTRDESMRNILNPSRPSHAFPMTYPPCCGHEPFPTMAGMYKFPPPKWYRKPAMPSCVHSLKIDFDEFVTDFNLKLHLRVPVLQKQHLTSHPSWCAGRDITPPPAPHPALVRLQVSPTLPIPPSPIVCAPSTYLCPFRSPSPFSQPTTFAPSQTLGEISGSQQVARLPRRTPQHASMTHRRGSSTLSEGSPTSSRSSSACRSSSFSSDVSARRRSSSSSSSSPSAPTTPESSQTNLPEVAQVSSVSIYGIDLEHSSNPFGFSVGVQMKPPLNAVQFPSTKPQEASSSP